jgi:hypothetical protein
MSLQGTDRKEYFKKRYWTNRDEYLKNLRERRTTEEYRAKQRAYRAQNRERFRENERQYYREHSVTILANKRESQRIRARCYYWSDKFAKEPTEANAQRLRQAQDDLQEFLESKKS